MLEKAKGDLSHFVRKWRNANVGSKNTLSDEMLIMVTLNVMDAINRFHKSEDMYYGDLKPGNVLISREWKAKFDDFGISHFFRGGTNGYLHGLTKGFCLPDVENYQENNNSETIPKEVLFANDVYPIHVILRKSLLPFRKRPEEGYNDIINNLETGLSNYKVELNLLARDIKDSLPDE